MGSEGAGYLLITFFAGILSVLSPCILPLLPGFLAYFSGLSLDEAKLKNHRKTLILAALCFSLGFLFTFLAFGLVAGGLSYFLISYQVLLLRIGGLLIIVFGLHQLKLIKIPFLYVEKRINHHSLNLPQHVLLRSFIIGTIFALGWTPCYGPIVGAIFTLGATSGTIHQSLFLFFFYGLGFTLPILLLALFMDQLSSSIRNKKNALKTLNWISGILIIIIGILMLTNSLSNIVNLIDFFYTDNKIFFF